MQVEVKRAELVGQMDGWTADARVYKLDPPYTYYDCPGMDYDKDNTVVLEYVIVSAVVVAFTGIPEVLVFPARKVGDDFEPINMIEIVGRRMTLDHELLLNELGYEV